MADQWGVQPLAQKVNPRRIPRSQADVEKAFRDGAAMTMEVMIFTLGTDMDMSDEWLDKYHERFMAHLKALNAGYITVEDLKQTTYQEKGWETDII